MVGGIGANQAPFSRDQASDLNGYLVGLGAAATEHRALDPIMVERGQPFGEVHNTPVKVATVGVQGCLLLRHGFNDSLIGMPYGWDVIVHIDVATPIGVEQVGPLTPHDLEGFSVKKLSARTQRTFPPITQRVFRHDGHSS